MTINCHGRLIDFEKPKLMGILNLTPDSFYDGGSYKTDKEALQQVEKMLHAEATFIDIGGQSSRPDAKLLSPEEEASRVLPLIELILAEFPETLISVDTFHSSVAQRVVEAGAVMINDIAAGNLDENMLETVAKLQVPYIMMHMRGTPKTMQSLTNYKNLIEEVLTYFSDKVKQAYDLGVNDIIIDPGFGFAKTIDQNFELIRSLERFKTFEAPVLMGLSRKSSICKLLNVNPDQALNGTTALHTLSLLNGADILRVHDVDEARECVEIIGRYNS